MIRCGDLRGASVRFSADRESRMTTDGELVIRSSLPELSIVHDPAQFGTAVWLQDEDPGDLPPDIRATRSRFQASCMARAARYRPAARQRPESPPCWRASTACWSCRVLLRGAAP